MIARSIYIMMSRRGVIEVLSGGSSSYELDDLTPQEGGGILPYTPIDLMNAFQKKKTLELAKGTLAIWGDFEGWSLNKTHVIANILYNQETNVLTIEFDNQCLLKVKNPRMIYCTNSYLKIIKAKEILWQVTVPSEAIYTYSYLNTGNDIKTQSNTKWVPHKYDIGIGQNAVYIQG